MNDTCQGCGAPLPPNGRHRPRKWCSERCRKTQYAGKCIDCGGPTNGTTPSRGLPKRCATCAARHQHLTRHWTPQRIVHAIHEWAAEHDGEPPAATDWNVALARLKGQIKPDRDTRRFPPTNTVRLAFGTWNAAIRAAGYIPRGVGQYNHTRARKRVAA